MRADTRSDLQELRRVGELMTERQLLDAVRAACRWAGLLTYHTYSSRRSEPGFPDLVAIRPPRVLFIELKVEKGRLSRAQEHWLKLLRLVPCVEVFVWRPSDWPAVREVLR